MHCVIVAPEAAPYVRRDAEILGRRHTAEIVVCHRLAEYFRLPAAVARADVVLVWFAKLHALAALTIARSLNRPTIVIAAGDDVCSLPAEGYGMLSRPHKAWCPQVVAGMARTVITVSRFARWSASRHIRKAEAWPVVPLGFAPAPGQDLLQVEREPIVLTISRVTRETLRIKGLRLLAEVARLLPQVSFVLVGGGEPEAEAEMDRIRPVNLTRVGRQTEEQVARWCTRATVYLQPSLIESFGAAVAEAMLGGAIPVLPRSGALPEVAGPAGVYFDAFRPETVSRAVRRALDLPAGRSREVQQRIRRRFSYARRERGLQAAIDRAVELTR